MKLIAIGGMGCALLARFAKQEEPFTLLAIDSDTRSLAPFAASQCLHIGNKQKGTNGNPLRGRESAELAKDALFERLAGAKQIILVAGMGGGTGSGATQIVTYVAHELRIPCRAIFSMPLDLEGEQVQRIAELGVEAVRRFVADVQLVHAQIPQDTSLPPTPASLHQFLGFQLYFHLLQALPDEA